MTKQSSGKTDDRTQELMSEFKTRHENLVTDISGVDRRAGEIQKNISTLDIQVENLKNLIKGETDSGKKGKLYGLLNECLELLAKYHDIYLKCLDIKHKYRKEEDDLLLKRSRFFEIDMRKVGRELEDLNLSNLVSMMQALQNRLNDTGGDQMIHEISGELEENDSYKLG